MLMTQCGYKRAEKEIWQHIRSFTPPSLSIANRFFYPQIFAHTSHITMQTLFFILMTALLNNCQPRKILSDHIISMLFNTPHVIGILSSAQNVKWICSTNCVYYNNIADVNNKCITFHETKIGASSFFIGHIDHKGTMAFLNFTSEQMPETPDFLVFSTEH